MSQLFSAAKQATHFKELRTYYFHNCVYGRVYRTERFDEPVPVPDLLAECGPHYKLIMVGDALMAPYELMLRSSGTGQLRRATGPEGIVWLMQLAEHFHRRAWLNPEPPSAWWAQTIRTVRSVFPMFPLTLDGLGEAVTALARRGHGAGGVSARAEGRVADPFQPLGLDDRTALLVLTGAGVSAESGLPTYRGTGGLWRSLRLRAARLARGLPRRPGAGVALLLRAARGGAARAEPNAGHRALVEAERRLGERFLLVTQNVDGLHRRARAASG